MAHQEKSTELLLVGLLAMAMGALVLVNVTGIIPGRGAGAPLWVGAVAALVFVLAGAALVLRWLAGGTAHDGEMPHGAPFWLRAAYYCVGLACIAGLAAVGTWVAFGPGVRAFSLSMPFLGKGPATEWLGRTVFGLGAVLCWLFVFVAARKYWQKLRS